MTPALSPPAECITCQTGPVMLTASVVYSRSCFQCVSCMLRISRPLPARCSPSSHRRISLYRTSVRPPLFEVSTRSLCLGRAFLRGFCLCAAELLLLVSIECPCSPSFSSLPLYHVSPFGFCDALRTALWKARLRMLVAGFVTPWAKLRLAPCFAQTLAVDEKSVAPGLPRCSWSPTLASTVVIAACACLSRSSAIKRTRLCLPRMIKFPLSRELGPRRLRLR